MPQTETEARREKLTDDLNKAIEVLGNAGRRNYVAAFTLAALATISSVVAGILAFLSVDGVIVGVLALIPALFAVIVGRLKIQERANWYYRKRTALFALYNELHFELPDPATSDAIAGISKKWSALNGQMGDDWRTGLALSIQELAKSATAGTGGGPTT